MKPQIYDSGDYCLRTSLYCVGKLLNNKYTRVEEKMMRDMIVECRLDNLFGHRKSEQYTWSKDIHNGKKSLRYRFWEIFLKPYGKDLYCGLNCDQYRALALFLYLARGVPRYRNIAKNILIGYVLRLGFSPSLTETAIFKPQSFVLLLKVFRYLFPAYLLSLAYFRLSAKASLMEPISKNTTNKISLLPTMRILGYAMPSDKYIKEVYEVYFNEGADMALIKNSMIDGLLGTINDYTEKTLNPILKFPDNLPCPCKSGIKFKNCCLPKIPRYIHIRDAEMLQIALNNFQKQYKNKK
jgi:hypothetical protein